MLTSGTGSDAAVLMSQFGSGPAPAHCGAFRWLHSKAGGTLRWDIIVRGEEFADLWGLHPVELRRPVRPTLRSPKVSSSERQSPHAIRH